MSKTKPKAGGPTCLRDGCEKPVELRGLCLTDYSMARVLVKRGEQTWEKLEEMGCCLPAKRGSGGDVSGMARWIKSKQAKKP